jgi:predicted ABC-type exoprotein transport system permease subunit
MQFNALVTLLLPLALAYGILCYGRFLQRRAIHWPHVPPAVLYAAFSLAAVFTMIRNLPLHLF